jgi:hypothetical protein
MKGEWWRWGCAPDLPLPFQAQHCEASLSAFLSNKSQIGWIFYSLQHALLLSRKGTLVTTQKRESFLEKKVNRRRLIQVGTAGIMTASTMGLLEKIAWQPVRIAEAATTLPDIQFDIGSFLPAAISLNDGAGRVVINFGPIYTVFLTIQLTRKPTTADA